MFTQYALDILDNKINLDTVIRFSTSGDQDKTDAILDSLSLVEEQSRKEKQHSWLKKKNLMIDNTPLIYTL